MTTTSYTADNTGLLLVDPYNDFLSEGGKLWPMVQAIAVEVVFLTICGKSSRQHALRKFSCSSCRTIARNRVTTRSGNTRTLARSPRANGRPSPKGHGAVSGTLILSPRGRYHHQGALGAKRLCQHRSGLSSSNSTASSKVIVIGLLANTCIESTGRFAMELGYHVTLVKDATAAFTARDDARRA